MTKQLEDRFAGAEDVVIFHVQTVFEGHRANTPKRGHEKAREHKIKVPVGYDASVDGDTSSAILGQFGTGGTPWTIIIDKRGVVRVNEVTPGDVDRLARTIEDLRKEQIEADDDDHDDDDEDDDDEGGHDDDD